MDNIEDIYYNKYLKYKYKYLELKGNGIKSMIFGKSQEEIEEEKLYGPELLERIKSAIETQTNNTSTTKIDYLLGNRRDFDIDILNNFEISLRNILELIEKVQELTAISDDIKLIKEKIYFNGFQPYKHRMINYNSLETSINNFFKKHKSLSTFPILNTFFKLYFKIIEKVIKQKEKEIEKEYNKKKY